MKKFITKKIIFIFVLSIITLCPNISFAEDPILVGDQSEGKSLIQRILDEDKHYKFMVPFGPFTDSMSNTTDLSGENVLIDYLRTWFKFLIGIGGIIGVVRLIKVGFDVFMTGGKVDALSKAKSELTAIVTSLLLVAASWVFLNTINPALVKSSILFPKTVGTTTTPLPKVDDTSVPDKDVTAGIKGGGYYFVLTDKKNNTKVNEGPYKDQQKCREELVLRKAQLASTTPDVIIETEECYEHFDTSVTLDEQETRAYLANSHIFINKKPCTEEQPLNCTSVAGLNSEAMDRIIALSKLIPGGQSSCTQKNIGSSFYCPVLITGGTETAGHSSHGPQFPFTLDLRYTGEVHNFLEKSSQLQAPSFCQNTRYNFNGYWYVHEVNGKTKTAKCGKIKEHFHVCKEVPNSARIDCGSVDASRCKDNPTGVGPKICK